MKRCLMAGGCQQSTVHFAACHAAHLVRPWPAVAAIRAAVEALPCLEAVELTGLSDAAAGTLLAAWQAALQQRGRQGCVVQTADGALRLARVGE